MLAAYNPASMAFCFSSCHRSSRSTPLSSISRSCGTSSWRTKARVVAMISCCSSVRAKSTAHYSATRVAGFPRRAGGGRGPGVQQLELQAQLLDLPRGRPVVAAGGGGGGAGGGGGDPRAQQLGP